MKKLTILLMAVFLALCVGVGIAQMNKGDLINKQTESVQQGRVLTDSDSGEASRAKKGMEKPNPKEESVVSGAKKEPLMPGDEIMVILYPSPPAFDPSPTYQFGDGIRGTRPPSEMNKADLIESLHAKKPPKGYRYVLGFTPKEDGPFVVYSTRNGTITAMLKKGSKKPTKYEHQGLIIDDLAIETDQRSKKLFVGGLSVVPGGTSEGDGGPTCWHCYEINGETHCFEVECPFDISSGEGEPSVSPEVLRIVTPKDPGSSLPPGSTVPGGPGGRSTGTTSTGDPGRGTQDGSSSSSSSTTIERGGGG
jgi:hypothetical protein